MQLNQIDTKMIPQRPIIFRPYNHFPTTITPTFDALNTNEPRVSAFKVVAKRPIIPDVTLETPLEFRRGELNHYNSLDSTELINRNCIDDGKLFSMSNSYKAITPNEEPNAIGSLNFKKNTPDHDTATQSTCDNLGMPCDLTIQPKVNDTCKNDVNSYRPVIQYRYTSEGNCRNLLFLFSPFNNSYFTSQ